MSVRNALPFEFLPRWPDLRRFFAGAEAAEDGAIGQEVLSWLEQRDRELEDFLAKLGSGMPVIDMGDGAVPTGFSKGWWVNEARVLRRVVGTLSVAGATDTVANVVRDGASVGTITIPSGERVATADVGAAYEADQFWQQQVTTAGTGAGGLTFYGEFG